MTTRKGVDDGPAITHPPRSSPAAGWPAGPGATPAKEAAAPAAGALRTRGWPGRHHGRRTRHTTVDGAGRTPSTAARGGSLRRVRSHGSRSLCAARAASSTADVPGNERRLRPRPPEHGPDRRAAQRGPPDRHRAPGAGPPVRPPRTQPGPCLLYTSDAADDLLCVDL